jgi:GxxExxY protein
MATDPQIAQIPQMENAKEQRDPRTYAVIGAAMEVHAQLGPGFPEQVYQDALQIELTERDIPFEREVALPIRYKGQRLSSSFRPDFRCYGSLIIEIKALLETGGDEEAQVLSYLKASGCEIGLLLNFGTPSLQYRRFILTKRGPSRATD